MLKMDSELAVEGSERGCPVFIKNGQVLAALVLETGFAGHWSVLFLGPPDSNSYSSLFSFSAFGLKMPSMHALPSKVE